MTLYIDLILLENIVMNYIILLATGMICKTNISYIRIFIASILGATYAIMLYLLNSGIYHSQVTKVLLSVCMVYISFNASNLKMIVKQIILFYLTSFCFGGAAYYLLYCVNPNLIKTINGVFIGTYPIKIAVLGGVLGFFIINISFKMIKSKLTKKDMLYNVTIFYKGKKTSIKVILDTGNFLTDPITKTPVMIVESEKLSDIIPNEILRNIDSVLYDATFDAMDEELKRRCSIIPFSSIGKNNGMIIGFRPDYININMSDGEKVRKKVIIGIYNHKIARNGLYSGLIGLNLLNESTWKGEENEYNSITKI